MITLLFKNLHGTRFNAWKFVPRTDNDHVSALYYAEGEAFVGRTAFLPCLLLLHACAPKEQPNMYLKAPEKHRACKRAFPRDSTKTNFPEPSTVFTKPTIPPNVSFVGAFYQCRPFRLILCLQLLGKDGQSLNIRDGKKGMSPLILADVSARMP